MKILFIGNSHTYVHYVPFRVKTILERNGIDADVTMLSHPGMGLDWHLQQSPTFFNLLYGNYDIVVLQHNAHPFPGKDSLLDAGMKMAKIVPSETKIFLYMTWSEKNNPEGQSVMSESYRELGDKIGAQVCPVGEVWWKIRENYPDELYFEDGEHSSVFGASLAAAVIAMTILERPYTTEEIYRLAKEAEGYEPDSRMIDMVMENGEYAMRPLKDLKQ